MDQNSLSDKIPYWILLAMHHLLCYKCHLRNNKVKSNISGLEASEVDSSDFHYLYLSMTLKASIR